MVQGHGACRTGGAQLLLGLVWLLLGLALVLLMGAAPASAAAPEVRLEVDGRLLKPDVPPVVIEGRTMVPVRLVGETLGASVHYEAATRQVFITSRRVRAVLTIDAPEAVLNGQTLPLDVPAQVVQGRTLVPLRFVADAFGATLLWDGETRTVSIWRRPAMLHTLTWQKDTDRARVFLGLEDEVEFTLQTLSDPHRVVLELEPVTIALQQRGHILQDPLFREIRVDPVDEQGRRARVTLELVDGATAQLVPSARGLTLELDYQVTHLEFGQQGRTPYLFIGTTGPMAYNVFNVQAPDRLVVDIYGVPGPQLQQRVESPVEWAKQARSSHFQREPDIVRVVIDFSQVQHHEVSRLPDGLMFRFVPQVTAVAAESLPGRTRLRIDTSLPVDGQVTLLPAEKRLVVTIPEAQYRATQREIPGDGLAFERITVAPAPGGAAVIFIVELPYYLGHEVVSAQETAGVQVDLVTSPVYKQRIFVDAGHGGGDPGANSPGGMAEKTVTLAISLKLQELLEEAGAAVLMSRTTDQSVGLSERARLANQAAADLFISVHANSAAVPSPTSQGTETYFTHNHPLSRQLAGSIQQELLHEIRLTDRKVKQSDFVVLREAKMPAALVEIAFLSHAAEEALLIAPAFQLQAARGIRQGIFHYYWQQLNGPTSN